MQLAFPCHILVTSSYLVVTGDYLVVTCSYLIATTRYFSLLLFPRFSNNPANIFLFKVNNRNSRKRCEICSKLTTKTPEIRQWVRSSVFIVNFKHFLHLFLVFLLLTLNK